MEELLAVVLNTIVARVAPQLLDEESKLPAITYEVIDSIPDKTMDGPTGKKESRIEVDVWALSYSVARQLSAEVAEKVDGLSDTCSEGAKHTFYIEDINQLKDPEEGVYHHMVEFKVNSFKSINT